MSRIAASLRVAAGRAVRATIPDSAILRIVGARRGNLDLRIPPPVEVHDAPTRLLIAPANYAGQGHAWAQAAGHLDGVEAVNLEVTREEGFAFPADFRISDHIYVWARRWSREHTAAVEKHFSHVLVEAERSVLGSVCGFDVRREGEWLDRHGVSRAYVSHGSDLRLPSRHAELDRWSVFRDSQWELIPSLEEAARKNGAFLEEQGRPVFVSTPDLLLDAPGAAWLPVVVDPSRWVTAEAPLSAARPVVFHAPTNPRAKGSDLITPIVDALDADGLISYRPATGIPAEQMSGLVAQADIVLDQFRAGSYGVAACEAMSAGRVVVGHISAQVRAVAEAAAGMPLPIVEADPDSIGSVLRDIVAEPDRYRQLASTGPTFVERLHNGTYSAGVLSSFLS